MSWLHRHQRVPYCQLNCVCHQMKLLLGGVASLFRRHCGRRLFGPTAQQLHVLWFMGLIKTLLNARSRHLKGSRRICILLLLYFCSGCAIFLSIPDELLGVYIWDSLRNVWAWYTAKSYTYQANKVFWSPEVHYCALESPDNRTILSHFSYFHIIFLSVVL
jgi:hypothetical protein